MLFNSAIFLLYFLPLACIGYQIAANFGRRAVLGWLAFASVVFYSWWNWHFIFVLLGSTIVNFAVSRLMASSKTAPLKKFWLVAGIALNLGALIYFKYLFHVLQFFTSVGFSHHVWHNIALPLGISFFTFTQIGYLVDLSNEQAEPQSFIEYALFVSFFPHLIAGPILHHKEMMPQFLAEKDFHFRSEDLLVGISWFVLGLAKKCILADTFGPIADRSFAAGASLGSRGAWFGVVTYSLQLYFDFSGYSDMAIGLARMFSIQFPMNFNSPYKAASVVDFWQRWHMTLTRYLTLYLYNPISLAVSRRRLRAGKKVSQKAAKTVPGFLSMIVWPTLATMFLVGIWHGAGSQFIIFGVLHGFYICVNHAWRLFGPQKQSAARQGMRWLTHPGSVLLTYLCVLIAQVFFRAESAGAALHYLAGMTGRHRGMANGMDLTSRNLLLVVIGLGIVWFLPNTQEILGQAGAVIASRWRWLAWKPAWKWSATVGLLFFIALMFISNSSTFLYFQF